MTKIGGGPPPELSHENGDGGVHKELAPSDWRTGLAPIETSLPAQSRAGISPLITTNGNRLPSVLTSEYHGVAFLSL